MGKIKSKRFEIGYFDEQIDNFLKTNKIKKEDVINVQKDFWGYTTIWFWNTSKKKQD